ncbi:MAG: hypothetical protein WC761_04100 [Candidatus Paceibacterota bacterium]|jgi:hypothetical protein
MRKIVPRDQLVRVYLPGQTFYGIGNGDYTLGFLVSATIGNNKETVRRCTGHSPHKVMRFLQVVNNWDVKYGISTG